MARQAEGKAVTTEAGRRKVMVHVLRKEFLEDVVFEELSERSSIVLMYIYFLQACP